MAYTKLFSSIVTSSIWGESIRTRIVWITLLALADKNGEVQASIPGLARVSCVPVEDCENAIKCFLSPDKYSRTKDDDGRRIEAIDGGWHILNHSKYRNMASKEDAQAQNAERQRRHREKLSRNAIVTESNAGVTEHRDIAEAYTDTDTDTDTDTKAETEKKKKAVATLPLPFSLDNDDFKSAWKDWLAYLKEKRKSPTLRTMQMQLQKLSDMGSVSAIKAINKSIESGWQSLYSPKDENEKPAVKFLI